MGVGLGWIVLALAGVAGAPPAESRAAPITYTVRVVDAEGLGWREAVFTRLKPVTRQGAATIWTAPRDVTAQLLAQVGGSPAARILQGPKVTSLNGDPVHITSRANRKLVTQVAWDGALRAPEGASEAVRSGCHATMVGRKLDQGILVKVVLEDTEVRAIHRLKLDDRCRELSCDGAAACGQSPQGGKATTAFRKVAIEIPEIGNQEVVGEWLIPHGEALLVSFGVHTVASTNGKAVMKERLAIIEADEVADASAVQRTSEAVTPIPDAINVRIQPPFLPAPISKIPMPAPLAPSRSIPQGYHTDGTPADLPPLPADESDADESSSESSEPMPSPQTKKPQQQKPAPAPAPVADSGARKAAFTLPKSPTVFLPSIFMPSPSVGFQFLLPLGPLSLRLLLQSEAGDRDLRQNGSGWGKPISASGCRVVPLPIEPLRAYDDESLKLKAGAAAGCRMGTALASSPAGTDRMNRTIALVVASLCAAGVVSCGTTSSGPSPELAANGDLEVTAKLVSIGGPFRSNELYDYVYVMKYHVLKIHRGTVDGADIFVGHYNPLKRRAAAQDKFSGKVGGNVERFQEGDVHRLALEAPLNERYLGGIIDRHVTEKAMRYRAIWTDRGSE